MNNLYKVFSIWHKKNEKCIEEYKIFQRISDNFYTVQSKNSYYPDEDFEKQRAFFYKQSMDLFLDNEIVNDECFFHHHWKKQSNYLIRILSKQFL